MILPTIEIDEWGNMHTLYADELCLHEIGIITNVRKASNVEFCECAQEWKVSLLNGEVIHSNKSRELAIEYEIAVMSPGGRYYEATEIPV